MSSLRCVIPAAIVIIIVCVAASGAAADQADVPSPISTAITYQGYLTDAGLPASGAWDFRFQLFDEVNGGSQIGPTVDVGDLPVNGGVFTASVNFGAGVFAGGARWLSVRVRPGASGGAYTDLSPRQAVTPAPLASSLPNVYSDPVLGFVGVGRNSSISSNEAFGVRAITTAGQYGGMYVEASDASGWPFYGFATNGSFRAWTYFEGDTGNWSLYNGGLRLTVPNTGGLIIGPAATHSLVIEPSTGSDGIRVLQTSDDAIQVGESSSYSTYGVYIPSPGVASYGLWPNTAQASGQWALYTNDNISAGNVLSAGLNQIAVVAGDEPLTPGELVAVAGIAAAMPGSHQLVPTVVAAAVDRPDGMIGVVESRLGIVPHDTKFGDDAETLESVPGLAMPGDFVSVVVRGVTEVLVEEGLELEIGQRLTIGASTGRARPLQIVEIEGVKIAESAPSIGVVVGLFDDRDVALVYVAGR